ncbi:ATP-dependent DNA helicase DinG [Virgibacillus soli]|uniref:ATP-dependent DNA helicase DinG n=1 Tax=Paracerasibacillus soli TaxID=480284 RepID=UPI0035E945C3
MDKYVVIDLETTGHSPKNNDKIIEVGIVVIENDEIVDTYSTFLNPKQTIPPFIVNLTGISNDDVADAPTFEEKAYEIAHYFEDCYIIAHNISFDLGFLNAELANFNIPQLKNPVLDTVELARILFPTSAGFKLEKLAEFLDIEHEDPHRALSDAYVTAKLFLKIKEKLHTLPIETIDHLLQLEPKLHSDLFALLYAQKKALQYTEDIYTHIETYRGIAYKKPVQDNPNPGGYDCSYGDFLDELYESNGVMETKLKHYEKRQGQRQMSEYIQEGFDAKKHVLIEAETGTGKSIAYLIPAIYEAVRNDERIVISTHTTQLQSQLLEEEIPLIRSLIPFHFSATLLKGKQHYISFEKLERELEQIEDDNYDIVLTKAMILVWLLETETGDIDEVHLPSRGTLFYQKLSAESEGTFDPTSPWFSRSYYQRARKRAQQAHLVITNHALLCTDMVNNFQFLPKYNKAIIDEAHHLEDTAAHHYGLKLDYMHIAFTFNQLGHTMDSKWFAKVNTGENFNFQDLQDEWDKIYQDAKFELDILFRTIYRYVTDQQRAKKSLSDVGRIQYHVQDNEKTETWLQIKEMAARLTRYIRDLIHLLSLIQYKSTDSAIKENTETSMKQLQLYLDELEFLFLTEDSSTIKWIEIDSYGAKNAVYTYSEPKEISHILSEHLFAKKQSIVLTSATLTMQGSFHFIENRLGLPKENTQSYRISSPFSYKDQVQVLIPSDFPNIKNDTDEFIYSTTEAILSLAEITNGRMLVLFTSYDMLRKCFYLMKEIMDQEEYMVIAQGISSGSRSRLKKNFQKFEKAILLGTSSFWEGVDIPGEDLSCLMIVRLPFQAPNHPVYAAKAEHLKSQGKNAFMDLALPHAVIRFKQGFGRLIRSKKDRGIVFICDSRIVDSRYGQYFINSIPEVPIYHLSTTKLMEHAKEWF